MKRFFLEIQGALSHAQAISTTNPQDHSVSDPLPLPLSIRKELAEKNKLKSHMKAGRSQSRVISTPMGRWIL